MRRNPCRNTEYSGLLRLHNHIGTWGVCYYGGTKMLSSSMQKRSIILRWRKLLYENLTHHHIDGQHLPISSTRVSGDNSAGSPDKDPSLHGGGGGGCTCIAQMHLSAITPDRWLCLVLPFSPIVNGITDTAQIGAVCGEKKKLFFLISPLDNVVYPLMSPILFYRRLC